MKKYIADETLIKEAIRVITDALEMASIPPLEGAIAMHALILNLKEKGLDVQAERNLSS